MIQRNLTYTQSVDLFVGANVDWLGDTEQPMITALYKSAEVLDKRTSATLLAEFRQVFKEVLRGKPVGPSTKAKEKDEFDALMEQFGE